VRRWSLLAAVVVVGVALDQVTKHLATAYVRPRGLVTVVEGLLDLRYAINPGAFFSLGAELPPDVRRLLFVIASIVATALIVRLYARTSADQRALRVGLALLLAGAIGNLIDRVVSGAVVDFVHLYWRDLQWATFNVADVLITAGLGALFLDLFRRRDPSPSSTAVPSSNPTVNEIDS
jgi:lipoprotein signal peptidase